MFNRIRKPAVQFTPDSIEVGVDGQVSVG